MPGTACVLDPGAEVSRAGSLVGGQLEALRCLALLSTRSETRSLGYFALQATQVVTSDVSVSGFPGRAARREISLSRGARQRCDDRLAQVRAVRGLRYEVLSAQSSACWAAPCLATCLVCLAARHGQPRAPWVAVTAMAPRAVRRVVWVPSCATSSTSMAQAERRLVGAGPLPAGEGCCHSDVDRAWSEGRGWRRGAEKVEAEAALGEGGDARGEPVPVEAVPGPLAWVALERLYCTFCATRRRVG